MPSCVITPISAFQSTNLNSKIDSYSRLADRIVRSLGAPLVSIEIHQDQIFENISIACEFFSKFCGYTKEYLIFDSLLYDRGVGIRLDHLFSIAGSDLSDANKLTHNTLSRNTAPYLKSPDNVYISNTTILSSYFASVSALSGIVGDGIFVNQILDSSLYASVSSIIINNETLSSTPLSSYFTQSIVDRSLATDPARDSITHNNMFDYDLMDYRKVMAVTDFEEGTSTGLNSLFSIEQTLAQQTYFSYSMGNNGFDLVSWYCVKNWLETREKILGLRKSYEFNERTQYMRIYPEPTETVRFYGVVPCYVERPIKDIIKELWVYQYALALTKISVGYVRGKFGPVQLFGGQVFSQDIMTQGQTEKDKLELQLSSSTDNDPVGFFIG